MSTRREPAVDDLTGLEFEVDLGCEMQRHAEGVAGCAPAQRGAFYANATHGLHRAGGKCEPQVIVVCLDKAVAIRQEQDVQARCPRCGAEGPLRRFFYVVGPVGKVGPAR